MSAQLFFVLIKLVCDMINLYINDIETTLENALNTSKDKSYFYSRKDYISYLIQIYKLNGEEDKIIKILEEYSFDRNICEMYVEELIKQNKIHVITNAIVFIPILLYLKNFAPPHLFNNFLF